MYRLYVLSIPVTNNVPVYYLILTKVIEAMICLWDCTLSKLNVQLSSITPSLRRILMYITPHNVSTRYIHISLSPTHYQ